MTPTEAMEFVARLRDGITPGPWRMKDDEEGEPALCIYARGLDIATAWRGYIAGDSDARLIAAAPALLDVIEALAKALADGPKVKPLAWDHDGRRLSMDDTLHFSHGYDWDGYEILRQESYGPGCGYIIWPERIAGESWSLYGTADGLYVSGLKGEEAAKAAADADHRARVLAQLEGQA